MIIRRALLSDVDNISLIHVEAFPDFFLTKLGTRFLRKYYSAYIESQQVVLVCIYESRVVGFVVGANDSQLVYDVIVKKRFEFIPCVFDNMFNFNLYRKVFSRIKTMFKFRRVNESIVIPDNYNELTSIGVLTSFQGKGVGKLLLAEYEKFCFSYGCDGIFLTTDFCDNESVISFYKLNGFQVVNKFLQDNKREMIAMQKNIGSQPQLVSENENRVCFLPFALPEIGEEEINEVVDSLRTGWVTTGPKAKKFEEAFTAFLGRDGLESISVNSATSGLHLALEAVGVGPGDEVIVPTYTFTATSEIVRYLGATPVMVDVDLDTFNMTSKSFEKAITNRTKAVIPVHFAGLACDMDPIISIAKKHDIRVIEDAAHALPAMYKGKLIGTLASDVTVFSFYANKTMTTGEGGMVVTANPEIAKRCKVMRLHGISRDAFDRYTSTKPAWSYEIIAPGYKYNMPDIAAAIGIHQLVKLPAFQEKRQVMADFYNESFKGLPIVLPALPTENSSHAWHLYPIRLRKDANISRDKFIERMSELGVGCSVHFIPLHLHPYWRDTYSLTPEMFPIAQSIYESEVSLPLYTKMTQDDLLKVVSAVKQVLANG